MVTRNPPRSGSALGVQSDPGDAGASVSDQKSNWPQEFHDAAAGYMTAVAQIGAGLHEKQRGALEALHQTPRDGAQTSLNDDIASSYRDLIDAIQRQDAERIKTIQSNYTSRVIAAYGEVEATQRNRQIEYLNALQNAWHSARTEMTAAFQAYLDAVKRGSASIPASGVDPAVVAAVGQSLVTIAGYAYAAALAAPASFGSGQQ
jgi:hypothetical protein